MRGIAYIRVSTEEQIQGVSLDNQLARIKEYCKFREIELIMEVRDEGISGGKNKGRAGFMQVLDAIEKKQAEVIVLYSLERISRDMLTLLALERLLDEFDCELHTVEGMVSTSTPDGFMSFAMRAFLGEMERRQIKFRTKKALHHKRLNGQVAGRTPYGFAREGDNLVPLEAEQGVIGKINELYGQGLRLCEIVADLNHEGFRTRTGADWKPNLVARLIDGYENSFRKSKPALGNAIRQFIEAIA